MTTRAIEATDEMTPVEGCDDEKSMLVLIRAAKELARVLIVVERMAPALALAFAVERAGRGIPAGDHWALEFCRTVLRRQVSLAVCLAVAELESES